MSMEPREPPWVEIGIRLWTQMLSTNLVPKLPDDDELPSRTSVNDAIKDAIRINPQGLEKIIFEAGLSIEEVFSAMLQHAQTLQKEISALDDFLNARLNKIRNQWRVIAINQFENSLRNLPRMLKGYLLVSFFPLAYGMVFGIIASIYSLDRAGSKQGEPGAVSRLLLEILQSAGLYNSNAIIVAVILALFYASVVLWEYVMPYLNGLRDQQIVDLNAEINARNEKLLNEIIRPAVRQLVDQMGKPSISLELEMLAVDGFCETFQNRHEVPTIHKERLLQSIRTWHGGNIGISGPRGSGKTTLIRSLCSTHIDENKRWLPVMLSAPVAYDGREFLLHVLGELCRAILPPDHDDEHDRFSLLNQKIDQPLLLFSALGLILLTGIWLLGTVSWNSSSPFLITLIGHLRALRAPELGALLMMAIIGLLITRHWISPAKTAGRQSRKHSPLQKRADYLLRRVTFQRTIGESIKAGLSTRFVSGEAQREESASEEPLSVPEIARQTKNLIRMATENDFQRVIVGIDEMDKIEDIKEACKLLNDLKAIFNIPNCFYLVSISANAMSNFERRGLPFRDAFDSAFDEVRHIDHCDFSECRRLLVRRSNVRMGEPYFIFLYALSGGLPRDLIRMARRTAEISSEEKKSRLLPLGRRLLREDIRGKLRALDIDSTRLGSLDDMHELRRRFVDFHELLSGENTPSRVQLPKKPEASVPRKKTQPNGLKSPAVYQNGRYVGETLTYLHLLFALDSLLVDLTEAPWREGSPGENAPAELIHKADAIARARQAVSYNHNVADFILRPIVGDSV